MEIKINKDNYVENYFIKDCDRSILITESQFRKISETPAFYGWKYSENDDDFTLEPLLYDDVLRERRKVECFDILNQYSFLWFNHLTKIQKQELEQWYNKWLDVTETKNIPAPLEWL